MIYYGTGNRTFWKKKSHLFGGFNLTRRSNKLLCRDSCSEASPFTPSIKLTSWVLIKRIATCRLDEVFKNRIGSCSRHMVKCTVSDSGEINDGMFHF